MQILGINLLEDYSLLKKGLYNFYSMVDWYNKFKNNEIDEDFIKEIINEQEIYKTFYGYTGKQIFINAIVGKNGSGKSTLLEIYNAIINNFAYEIKHNKHFCNFNEDYELVSTEIEAELYYELNKKIYCIAVSDDDVHFFNNEYDDLFNEITTLDELSNHCFYTVSTNYSLYYKNENWINQLFHKNDGYFTPIVLVPFRNNTNIEFKRENKLAEKRVMTLSLLLYKQDKTKFINDYIPAAIGYVLKNEEYYKVSRYVGITKYNSYEEEISRRVSDLLEDNKIKNERRIKNKKKILISDRNCLKLEKVIKKYWDDYFKDKSDEPSLYCKNYLYYKTLKVFINYETLAKQLDFTNLKSKVKQIIEEELWNESKLNYINLKIINCKRYLSYTYEKFYKDGKMLYVNIFGDDEKIQNITTYHELFTYMAPDFYDVDYYYAKTDGSTSSLIQLNQMSSGEQQLYNSLSYVIYHIKNAQSNQNGNSSGKIPYKYFNLIFDEAELYYHPEYQRCYITNLIKILNKSNLEDKGINITIITHSPFIISDISKTNILALDNGSVSDKFYNKTLASNIYDLLGNQFFMTSTIGNCAKLFIEKIILDLNSENDIQKETRELYEKIIENIGDEYLYPVLKNMLAEKMGQDFYQRQISEYEEKIEKLKKQQEINREKN